MKYYAIKRPDGSWIMESAMPSKLSTWSMGANSDKELDNMTGYSICERTIKRRSEALGYTCVEVSGFVEVGK